MAQPDQPSKNYTTEATRRLMDLAELVTGTDPDLGQIEDVLSQLSGSIDQLSEQERAQLNELSQLLRTDPSKQQAASSLSQDARFTLKPGGDRMQLLLSIRPSVAGGRDVEARDIFQWLRDHQISQGVDEPAVAEAVKRAADGQSADDAVVVRGAPPRQGQPERLELYARRTHDAEPESINPADFNNRQVMQYWMCREGDVVLRRIPAKPGADGYTAMGEPIKSPSLPSLNINAGANVEHRGLEYVAKASGVVVYADEHIEVRRMLVIEQEIHSTYPPIDFDGDVHIRAAVRSGAKVKATGDIVVEEAIEAAQIESTGGDVTLRHGVTGRHEGLIRAAGDIHARFAENVTLIAGQDIHIDIGSMHSRLIAGRSIHMIRGRGQMVGGSAMASQLIELKQAGSTSEVHTELCVGLPHAVMEQVGQIDEQIARIQVKRDETAELADKIKRTIGDPMKLKPDELKAYTNLRQIQLVCDVKTRALRTQREQALAEAARETGGRIDIHGSMMPRVIVRIGDAKHEAVQQHSHCRIVYKQSDRSINIQPLR